MKKQKQKFLSKKTLAWTSTIHKVQSLSLGNGAVDFDLFFKISGIGQVCTILSEIKIYDKVVLNKIIYVFNQSKSGCSDWIWLNEISLLALNNRQ